MKLMLLTESEMLIQLGARLREHRLRQNTTQKELALHSGVSESAIKKLEHSGQGTLLNFMKVVYALRLEQELMALFKIEPVSIAQIEALRKPLRQRASAALPKKISK
ncbi:MAG: helix-turn-helix domain-containing protein [Alcaligenaceae bacterium]|jgi:transcriptional regulator with XRE-family HTH domain|nr:helix-turn-helix domain-containing protein [Alcaligenaceae bacterium]